MEIQVVQHGSATVVPIEDLKDGDVVHTSQLLPTDIINVEAVYSAAFIGMTDKAIAGKLRIRLESVRQHFSKTMEQARADAVEAHLLRMQDTAEGTFKPNSLQHDATKWLVEKRLDPIPKEPVINIEQHFKGLEATVTSISVDEANEL